MQPATCKNINIEEIRRGIRTTYLVGKLWSIDRGWCEKGVLDRVEEGGANKSDRHDALQALA